MATSYAHHIVCNGSAASVFAALDFGTAGVLDGPPAAVGTSRTIDMGKVKIVEMMTAREVTPLKHSYTYVITNDDNPFAVKGYKAEVTVFPASENAKQCFVTWTANWSSANEGIAGLPGMIRGMIAGAEKAAAKL